MTTSEWYAVRLRLRFERFVALCLKRLGIEYFLPFRRITPRSMPMHGVQSIELPLFPGYVFCKCDESVRPSIITIPGVLAFIDVVAEQEITDLRRIIDFGSPVQLWPYRLHGTRLTIEEGPLRGVKGILETALDKPRMIFSFHVLHRSLALELDQLSGIQHEPSKSQAS
jgi:transcriptional antiterminator RfaH